MPAPRLPPVDLLLLSHNHYDHMDLPTIEALPGKDRIEVVVPLGLAGYFRERGYQRVRELDWYQGQSILGLEITGLPAIHFSKRTLFDRNRTLWTGYAVQGRAKRVYFAGDTAYGPVFRELGKEPRGLRSRARADRRLRAARADEGLALRRRRKIVQMGAVS